MTSPRQQYRDYVIGVKREFRTVWHLLAERSYTPPPASLGGSHNQLSHEVCFQSHPCLVYSPFLYAPFWNCEVCFQSHQLIGCYVETVLYSLRLLVVGGEHIAMAMVSSGGAHLYTKYHALSTSYWLINN